MSETVDGERSVQKQHLTKMAGYEVSHPKVLSPKVPGDYSGDQVAEDEVQVHIISIK